jgi:hypothetical protein
MFLSIYSESGTLLLILICLIPHHIPLEQLLPSLFYTWLWFREVKTYSESYSQYMTVITSLTLAISNIFEVYSPSLDDSFNY